MMWRARAMRADLVPKETLEEILSRRLEVFRDVGEDCRLPAPSSAAAIVSAATPRRPPDQVGQSQRGRYRARPAPTPQRVSGQPAAPDTAQQLLNSRSAVDGLDDPMMLPERCAGRDAKAHQRLANGGQLVLGVHDQSDLPALLVPQLIALPAFTIWRAEIPAGPKQIGEAVFVPTQATLVAGFHRCPAAPMCAVRRSSTSSNAAPSTATPVLFSPYQGEIQGGSLGLRTNDITADLPSPGCTATAPGAAAPPAC